MTPVTHERTSHTQYSDTSSYSQINHISVKESKLHTTYLRISHVLAITKKLAHNNRNYYKTKANT